MKDSLKNVIVIGTGIAGMSCALKCASQGIQVLLAAPFPSERTQSVMAAGGINAVLDDCEEGDSVESHIEDTLKGGAGLSGPEAVRGLCSSAKEIIDYLVDIGTVFTVDREGRPVRRAFGGQRHKRTYFCGSSTGKHIVSALTMELRRYESEGLVVRKLYSDFYAALIRDGECYGAILYDEKADKPELVYADALVMATGGENGLFGKTTGFLQCGSYAAGKLFTQGVELKNLEFVQYHPTTLETSQKRMLISEAARGEGGRLFYMDGDKRVYFMEDKYGPGGNLMTRDVVSREIFAAGKDVFLDVAFLGEKLIHERLSEVEEICMKYRGIDISKEPIPVSPSVHFFMGGMAVKLNHETNIRNLYAVGEAASMYHGANRLGGNSLMAALYSGRKAADDIAGRSFSHERPDFSEALREAERRLGSLGKKESPFPVTYVRNMLSDSMKKELGIVRNEENLNEGIRSVDYLLSVADKINYDNSVPRFLTYSLPCVLTLGKAVLISAKERRESRGSHYRSDYPEKDEKYACATIIRYDDGAFHVRYDREKEYES